MKLIRKKKFVAVVLDLKDEIFMVHKAFLVSSDIYPFCKTKIVLLKANETFTAVLLEYTDFTDIFSPDLITKLLKYSGINDLIINLIDSKWLLYKPIYSLKSVELEILKMYIEINLINGFIKCSKSPTNTLIFFI